MATRGVAAETLNELVLDVKRRELIKSEELKAQRNIASDGITRLLQQSRCFEQIAAMQKSLQY